MLCPEVWNFPPPKTVTHLEQNVDLDTAMKTVNMNDFYESLVITCPDELHTPSSLEEAVTDDCVYYRLSDCPVTGFLDSTFVENFVKNGKLYCLSVNRDCLSQNCVAITGGLLKLHVIYNVFQTLGLEGTKQAHDFYEVKIDLSNIKMINKVKLALSKLKTFDFIITWEPHSEDICPSSIAKYFFDNNINITAESAQLKRVSPSITEIPSLKDSDHEELSEWLGMLACGGNLTPTYDYVSTYSQPDSENPMPSTRISLLIAKGFFTPSLIQKLSSQMSEYASSREQDNFWASLSVQSFTDCPWRWNYSSKSLFQSHDSSTSIFFSKAGNTVYSIGQIKIS
ncbi:unnamed protein product [Plutella xylostella]|uniref:(diamondback moth) hypothetical protein n=1 Tax=Plutella xylostella TaxID=51655 RepID=A0A8S4G4H2_PLUXY|nr:unnamed protein product [Plutella xylostella]